MELSQHGFLEELLASGKESSCTSFSNGFNDFFPNGWNFDSFNENQDMGSSNPHFPTIQTPSDFPFNDYQIYTNFLEGFTLPELDSSSYTKNIETPPPFLSHEDNSNNNGNDFPCVMEDVEENGFLERENHGTCKVEMDHQVSVCEIPDFKMGLVEGKKNSKSKKIEGQPSKNLMAERRRRKRLNDRLSMLRAIVPKISKMDRTSILGDTIDYMKELLEKINDLKDEEMEKDSKSKSLNGISKEMESHEVLVRNSPKFDVERREIETRIEICCATRPGLLLSTVNTLEALGLEIHQCVISCFNDFSMQASCSEESGQKAVVSSGDIKEALFRNAGYGGKCL